ncbi:MAG: excinuclease ABC subunit UvrA [Flavobacteriales bacterium]|jgi:excinuclease ABC subunit A|nr:excinuclease ABC subunit UvrA [Flavobacteriales bacterium]
MAKHTHIEIYGANQHNLKNIDIKIPKNKLTVITGLSGSGKSSLAFDTLYAEGQRRYVESLSSYARQFMGKIDKPDVKEIKGLTPSIAIEQKVISTNSRSTVGSSTEIYDYLRLLYARLGKTISPISGKEVKKHHAIDVINFLLKQENGSKWILGAPIPIKKQTEKYQNILTNQGYSRIYEKDELVSLDDWKYEIDSILVIDRFKLNKENDDALNRLSESIELAFFEGEGELFLIDLVSKEKKNFNNRFELDGMTFIEPTNDLFSSNSPIGSCPKCQGYGKTIGLDKDLIIPNPNISIYEGAIAFSDFKGAEDWKTALYEFCRSEQISIHKPYIELSTQEQSKIWAGSSKRYSGIQGYFDKLEAKAYKIQNRILIARFRGKTACEHCKGKKLKPEALYVKFHGKDIAELLTTPLDQLYEFFNKIKLEENEIEIGSRILLEVNNRLETLLKVGLPYLNLQRASNTLSGGESQRIRLANSLSSSLVNSTYLLDEPSIGLHSHDTKNLINVLKELRDLGNTVVVVEHDEEIMQEADYIIDIGKEAGVGGGNIVFAGTYQEILKTQESYTAQFLNKSILIERNTTPPPFQNFIELKGAYANNLKNVDIKIPLGAFTVVSGMSGSGKSTLIQQILYPAIQNEFEIYQNKPKTFSQITLNKDLLHGVEFIDQNPIGKSSRSNALTYLKIFDDIRNLLAKQKLAKTRGYKPKHFSFNTAGGRCETCQGEGQITIEMQFLADAKMECEVCKGNRYQEEILDIKFQGKNIFDILNATVEEAFDFFDKHGETKISKKIKPLLDVGLSYIKLGQSSSTLSGGEAQRVKLASFLNLTQKRNNHLFIFDEPSTGLHFKDIQNLIKAFDALIEKGHSILVIEHHPDIIKLADWNIDLGPMGGNKGGEIVFMGKNEDFIQSETLTAKYLDEVKK